jgi:hypothetical protein
MVKSRPSKKLDREIEQLELVLGELEEIRCGSLSTHSHSLSVVIRPLS